MQKRVRQEKGVFVQIQGFMDRNTSVLSVANASVARQVLDESVSGLTVAEADQNEHRQTSQVSRVQTLESREKLLTKQLRSVAAAAKLMASETPELVLIAPPPVSIGTADLIAAANKMVQDVTPYASVLGPVVGADFLKAILASIASVQQAQSAGRTSRAQHVAATSETRRWAKRARLAVRVLNPLVSDALEHQPKLLAEWNACRKQAGVSRANASTTPTATTGATTGVATSAPAAPSALVAAGSQEVKSAA